MYYVEYDRNKVFVNCASMQLKGRVKRIKEDEYNLNHIFGKAIKGEKKVQSIFLFNEDGYLESIEWYASKNNYGQHSFTHDLKNKILVEKTKLRTDTNGIHDLEKEAIYKYDNNYNVLERIDEYSGSFQNKLHYNSQGLLIKIDKYNSDGDKKELEESCEYRYKEDILIQTEITRFRDNKQSKQYISKFKYDAFFNIIEELNVESGENDIIFSYEYQYDHNNNWIVSKHYRKEKWLKIGTSMYKRKIFYY